MRLYFLQYLYAWSIIDWYIICSFSYIIAYKLASIVGTVLISVQMWKIETVWSKF